MPISSATNCKFEVLILLPSCKGSLSVVSTSVVKSKSCNLKSLHFWPAKEWLRSTWRIIPAVKQLTSPFIAAVYPMDQSLQFYKQLVSKPPWPWVLGQINNGLVPGWWWCPCCNLGGAWACKHTSLMKHLLDNGHQWVVLLCKHSTPTPLFGFSWEAASEANGPAGFALGRSCQKATTQSAVNCWM